MHTCMCVCMWVWKIWCMHECMHKQYMHACMHAFMYACAQSIWLFMHVHKYVHAVQPWLHAYACLFKCELITYECCTRAYMTQQVAGKKGEASKSKGSRSLHQHSENTFLHSAYMYARMHVRTHTQTDMHMYVLAYLHACMRYMKPERDR